MFGVIDMPVRKNKIHSSTYSTTQKTPTYPVKKTKPVTKVYTSSPRPQFPRPYPKQSYGSCSGCGRKRSK